MSNLSSNKQQYIEWSEGGIHPWRRFFARMLDLKISMVLVGFIASIFFGISFVVTHIFLNSFGGFTFASMIILLLMFISSLVAHVFINAFLISRIGASIGKYLFGVSVYNADGSMLDYQQSLKREWMVFYRGEALWIPIINIIAWVIAYRDLEKEGITSWDRDLATKLLYRTVGVKHYIFVLIGVMLIFNL